VEKTYVIKRPAEGAVSIGLFPSPTQNEFAEGTRFFFSVSFFYRRAPEFAVNVKSQTNIFDTRLKLGVDLVTLNYGHGKPCQLTTPKDMK
jgi:hypothetical protein